MFSKIESFAEASETIKVARMNVEDMSLVKEVGLYFAQFILILLVMLLFQLIFIGLDSSNLNNLDNLLICLSFITIPIMVYFFINRIEKRSWRSIGFSKENILFSVMKGLLIGFVLIIVVVSICMVLGQYSFNGFDSSAIIYLIPFFICFGIQSFCEEIQIRGWTLTYFSRRHSVIISKIISCVMFLIPHLGNTGINLLGSVNLILIGFFLAILFLRFDNIWICGGLHTAWNFSEGLIFGFNVSGNSTPSLFKFTKIGENIINGGAFGPESSLITTVVIIIAIILVYWING